MKLIFWLALEDTVCVSARAQLIIASVLSMQLSKNDKIALSGGHKINIEEQEIQQTIFILTVVWRLDSENPLTYYYRLLRQWRGVFAVLPYN